jgi:rhodanese-related sulfurtransferase
MKLKSGAVVVDVRTAEEFQSGAYPGAINIPVQELEWRADEIPGAKPVIVYRASGMRSALAERVL